MVTRHHTGGELSNGFAPPTWHALEESLLSSSCDGLVGGLHTRLLEALLPLEDAPLEGTLFDGVRLRRAARDATAGVATAVARSSHCRDGLGDSRIVEDKCIPLVGFPSGWTVVTKTRGSSCNQQASTYKVYIDPKGQRFPSLLRATAALKLSQARQAEHTGEATKATLHTADSDASGKVDASLGRAEPDGGASDEPDGGASDEPAAAEANAEAHISDEDDDASSTHDAPPGIGVRCLRDAVRLLRGDLSSGRPPVWPEILRLAVSHWHALSLTDPSEEPPTAALLELGAHLAALEYASASPSLKARALANLCERALTAPPHGPFDALEALDRLAKAKAAASDALREAQRAAESLEPTEGATARQQRLLGTNIDKAVADATEELHDLLENEERDAPRLRERLRLPSLGQDREQATYWLLAEPLAPPSAHGPDSGAPEATRPRLLSESVCGTWCVVPDIGQLIAVLRLSAHASDAALLRRVLEMCSSDDEALAAGDRVSVVTHAWGEEWARRMHGDAEWRIGRTAGTVLQQEAPCAAHGMDTMWLCDFGEHERRFESLCDGAHSVWQRAALRRERCPEAVTASVGDAATSVGQRQDVAAITAANDMDGGMATGEDAAADRTADTVEEAVEEDNLAAVQTVEMGTAAPTPLTVAQMEDVLSAVVQLRASVKSTKAVVHGWVLEWTMRKPGSTTKGDLLAVDPRDGQPYMSQVAIKRKLGLEPIAPWLDVGPSFRAGAATRTTRSLAQPQVTESDDDREVWTRASEGDTEAVLALKQLLLLRYGQQAASRDCLPAVGSNDPLLGLSSRLASSHTLAQVWIVARKSLSTPLYGQTPLPYLIWKCPAPQPHAITDATLLLECPALPAPQLALRDLELHACTAVSPQGREGAYPDSTPLSAGLQLQVHIEQDGEKQWATAVVVAVWRDGGFRVQVGTDCEWLEDFPSPTSTEGRKLRGREWRPLEMPPAARPHPKRPPMRTLPAAKPQAEKPRTLRSAHAQTISNSDDTSRGSTGAAVSPKPSARQLGRSLVGLRVSVWWEEDEAWYDGTIREFDDVQGEHLVAYDDGEHGHEVLDECRWRRLDMPPAAWPHAENREPPMQKPPAAQPDAERPPMRTLPAAKPRAEKPQRTLRSAHAQTISNSDDASRGSTGAAVSPKPSARQLGRSLVGLRVSVWWEEDEAWYDGTIREFDDVQGEHLVAYDDGEHGHEVLDECRCGACLCFHACI